MREWKWTVVLLCLFGLIQSSISWIVVIYDYETKRRKAILSQFFSASSPLQNSDALSVAFHRDSVGQQHLDESRWRLAFPQTSTSFISILSRIVFVILAGIATDKIGHRLVLFSCGLSSSLSGLLWTFGDSSDSNESFLFHLSFYNLIVRLLSSIGSSSDVPSYVALSKCFLQSKCPTFIVSCWIASRLAGVFFARTITALHRQSNWSLNHLLSNSDLHDSSWKAFLIDVTSIHDSSLLVTVAIISSLIILVLSFRLYVQFPLSNLWAGINPQSLYYTDYLPLTQQPSSTVTDSPLPSSDVTHHSYEPSQEQQQNQSTLELPCHSILPQHRQPSSLSTDPLQVTDEDDNTFSWSIWLEYLLTERNILIFCFTISLSTAIQASHSDIFLRRLFGDTKESTVQATGGVVPSARLWPYVGYVVGLIPARISLPFNNFDPSIPLISPTLQILFTTIIVTPCIGFLADTVMRWERLSIIGLVLLVVARAILRSTSSMIYQSFGHIIIGISLSANWGCRGSALATNCLNGTEGTSYAVLKCADCIGVASASYFISYLSTVTDSSTTDVSVAPFPLSAPLFAFAIFVIVSGILLIVLSKQSSTRRKRSIISTLSNRSLQQHGMAQKAPRCQAILNNDSNYNDHHRNGVLNDQRHFEILDHQPSCRMAIGH